MRVGCVICSDNFVTFSDVSTIPCGHTFHSHCLLQWMETSNSCPTCRQKVTAKKVVKLFFESIGHDASQPDPDALQNQVDSLKFQVLEKAQLVKQVSEGKEAEKKKNDGLREECARLEARIKEQRITITSYKEQLAHTSEFVADAKRCQSELKKTKAQLKLFESIRLLVEDTNIEAEALLADGAGANLSDSICNLTTICCTMKKRMKQLVEEKKRYSDENYQLIRKLKETKSSLSNAETKLAQANSELILIQADLEASEMETKELKKQVAKLQAAIVSPSGDAKNSLIHRLLHEHPPPNEISAFDSPSEIVSTKEASSSPNRRKPPKVSNDFFCSSPLLFPDDEDEVIETTFPASSFTTQGSRIQRKEDRPSKKSKYDPTSVTKQSKEISNGTPPLEYSKLASSVNINFSSNGPGGFPKRDHFPKPIISRNTPKKPKKATTMRVRVSGLDGSSSSLKPITDFFSNSFDPDL